jgi:hypothetical protein
VNWVNGKAQEEKAVKRTELLNYCIACFGSVITGGWVDSFLPCHRDELSGTKSVTLEDSRLQVPRVLLEAAIEAIRTLIHDPCAELVFNLDEVGILTFLD